MTSAAANSKARQASPQRSVSIALTIAGSDSSGGAGIQADLKTFSAFGVYGASVITALTAQNTLGVSRIETVSAGFVEAQLHAVLSDLDVGAMKTGMLPTSAVVQSVAAAVKANPRRPLIIDPVMIATSGDALVPPDAIAAIKKILLPGAALITPNLPEAAALLDCAVAETVEEMDCQARLLLALGPQAVLLKGGHAVHGRADKTAVDIFCDAAALTRLEMPWIETKHTHGTGCTLSAAIAALLALGEDLPVAVSRAKTYVWTALHHGRDQGIGSGCGPLDHLYGIRAYERPA